MDINGIQGHAPIPRGTALDLLLGKFEPPTDDRELTAYKDAQGLLAIAMLPFAQINRILHEVRMVDIEGRQSLEMFKQAAELHDRIVTFSVLSGREPPMHAMTKQQLVVWGTAQYFDAYHLNTSTSSSRFKREKVKEKLEQDPECFVIEVDDDLKPAMGIALLDPARTLVYLKKNKSNHPHLLERGKVDLPKNVILVDNQIQAAEDFEERLRLGII